MYLYIVAMGMANHAAAVGKYVQLVHVDVPGLPPVVTDMHGYIGVILSCLADEQVVFMLCSYNAHILLI